MAVTARKTGAETRTRETRHRQGARHDRAEHEVHIVAVRLAQRAYGIPVARVHEIIHPCEVAAIPGSPDDVRGVLSLHGTVVPVLDLRRRTGLPPADDSQESSGARIVLVELDEDLVGLLVDGVAQVCRVTMSPLAQAASAASSGLDPELAIGVGRLGRAPITVLDIPKAARLDRTVADYVAEYIERARTRSAA